MTDDDITRENESERFEWGSPRWRDDAEDSVAETEKHHRDWNDPEPSDDQEGAIDRERDTRAPS